MKHIYGKTFTVEELKNYMRKLTPIANAWGGIDRELHIAPINQGGAVRGYMFSIDGTPPKGYALYIPCTEANDRLIIMDMLGKPIVMGENIKITGLRA